MLTALLLVAAATAPPDLEAKGVVLSPRPERSVAILQAGGRTRIVGIGESAFGGRVAAIAQGLVTLEYEGQRVELHLGSATPAAPAPAPLPAPPPAEVSELPARTMPRRDVERRLADEIPRILAETALVPLRDEGQITGFSIARIPEGSLLTEAGLRAGDVLTRINDVPLDSMATLISLWPRLQTESELKAVVLRDGHPVTLTVTLR